MSKAYQVVKDFEEEIAQWSGAKYGVAVSSCCNAIFLCLKYIYQEGIEFSVHIPKHTYPGVAMAIHNAGGRVFFDNNRWRGIYYLRNCKIVDSALRFKMSMYIPRTYYCLSFHYKKHLPIGRGGMVLTDDHSAVEWLKKARWDGRSPDVPLNNDNAEIVGWNMYMTPEQASRGLVLFDTIKEKKLDDLPVDKQNYPDLSTWRCFQ